MEYSVVIRTLGKAGDKYGRLLDSIERQTVKPKEVVVVLADGYEPAPYHAANERIVRTRKGMVNQRQVGFEQARAEWLVVVDDDVELRSDFAETTMRYAAEHHADAVFTGGDERTRLGGGKINLQDIRSLLFGARRYSRRKSPFYLRIGRTGGTVVNSRMKEDEIYKCQTANFQCFAISREAALEVHIEEEMWLEDTGYAWPDDRVFFYKAYLKGYQILYAPETSYHNLDAKTGRVGDMDKTYWDYYTHERNITIFWRKFLLGEAGGAGERLRLRLCFCYRCMTQVVLFILKCVVRRRMKYVGHLFKPYKDALRAYDAMACPHE